ncbi:MAG: HAD family hydrolase [Phycisphaerae bacterium]|nr:HAD family hydrolase [Phycisphaerae bacterium]
MNIGFLIDMDGVIYKGRELIHGADIFVNTLIEKNIPFCFLTNNSQRTRRDVVAKLHRFNLPVQEKHIFTCAMATARFLDSHKPNGTAYVIGEGGLLTALNRNGYAVVDNDPDFVIVGEGRTINFDMIEKAVQMVANGAKLIATNTDPVCPTDKGIRPGCGAIVAMIEAATGVKAFSVGKPSPVMMRMARKELGLETMGTYMIGDTMETDILGGLQMGYGTILVLSGNTSKQDLSKHAFAPDLIIDSVASVFDAIEDHKSHQLISA